MTLVLSWRNFPVKNFGRANAGHIFLIPGMKRKKEKAETDILIQVTIFSLTV